jgi:MATE family multidrug resistance protein
LKNIANFNISYSRVWFLAWPIILANLTIPLIGATNVAVVGRLQSPIYIGAVALGVLVLQCIYWSFAFLRKSTTGVTAQAFGEGDKAGVFAALFRSLIIATSLGLLVTILQKPIEFIAFKIIHGSEEVEAIAKVYFRIRVWGSIATMSNYVFLGWFYGIQKPKLALCLRIMMNLLNIPLAIYLALTLKMGVNGVAWAAFWSQHFVCFLSYIAAFVILFEHLKKDLSSNFKFDMNFLKLIFDRVKFTRLYKLNTDIFFRTLLVFFAFSWFTSKSASSSDLVLATNSVLINLFWFISYALDGFSNSAETLVGQAIGAGKVEMYRRAVKVTFVMSLVFALIFVLSYAFAGNFLVSVLTDLNSIQELAKEYMIWLVFIPIIGIPCFELDGIFFGATKTRVMRDMMFISFVVYALAMLVLPKVFANHGLWMALYIFLLVRAFTLYIHLPKIEKENFIHGK